MPDRLPNPLPRLFVAGVMASLCLGAAIADTPPVLAQSAAPVSPLPDPYKTGTTSQSPAGSTSQPSSSTDPYKTTILSPGTVLVLPSPPGQTVADPYQTRITTSSPEVVPLADPAPNAVADPYNTTAVSAGSSVRPGAALPANQNSALQASPYLRVEIQKTPEEKQAELDAARASQSTIILSPNP